MRDGLTLFRDLFFERDRDGIYLHPRLQKYSSQDRLFSSPNFGRPGPVRIVVQNGQILDRTRFAQIRAHVPAESLVMAPNRCAQAGALEKATPGRGSGSLPGEANVLPCNTPDAVNNAPDAQIRKAGNGQTTAPT